MKGVIIAENNHVGIRLIVLMKKELTMASVPSIS